MLGTNTNRRTLIRKPIQRNAFTFPTHTLSGPVLPNTLFLIGQPWNGTRAKLIFLTPHMRMVIEQSFPDDLPKGTGKILVRCDGSVSHEPDLFLKCIRKPCNRRINEFGR